jgi:biopolymer transport protein TolR
VAQVEESGKGGRSVNIELNIVPFIDLMSVMISFLIVSAVWSQISMIQLGSSMYSKKTTEEQPKPPPKADFPFRVDVKAHGFQVIAGVEKKQIPLENGEHNFTALKEELARVKQLNPEKTDAVLTMNDELAYELLIKTMDRVLENGFNEISVATAEAQ